MRKALCIGFLVTIMLLVAIGETQAYNPRTKNLKARLVQQYGLLAPVAMDPGPSTRAKGSSPISLGAYASDGGSPGEIIGRSWRDDQNHFSPAHFVGWRQTPQIHFIFNAQACGGHDNPNSCARWIHYNMFDPTTSPSGVFINGINGIPIQTSPFAEGGLYPNMDVNEKGQIIAIGEGITSPDGADYRRWVKMWWDMAPDGSWGTFIQDSITDQPPQHTGEYNYHYPVMGYQEYGGQYVTHILSINGENVGNKHIITYWRKVTANATFTGSWTAETLSDSVWSNSFSLAVAQDNSGKVSIVWVGYYQQSTTPPIFVKRSSDAGATWETEFSIIDIETEEWDPWLEVSGMIDSDGNTHVIWNAGGVDPCRLFHWTDRVAGPVAGGTTSLVDAFDFDGLRDMCGRFGSNMFTVGKHMVSECNGRLYATWIQAGDPDKGDSTDCVDPDSAPGVLGNYNGDIMMSISSSLDGALWDARRNLTNSKTPGCDGTDANWCDHDNLPSPARLAMNTDPGVLGATYWSSVPGAFEVRDALEPGYSDNDWYIDIQFVNDLFPDITRYNDGVKWTNNPIKWFRLPCVDPIIEPRIFMPGPFQHPKDWVKAGEQYDLEFEILNLGNAPLNVTNIEEHIVDGSGWMTLNTSTMNIPAASAGIVSITLNPGGAIDPPAGSPIGIEAWIVFSSDDPNNPVDSVQIRTVIADTVLSVEFATVSTGHGITLGALNNGNAGNWPNTGGYMSFYDTLSGLDEDCDSQEVYVYELSPMIMYSAAEGDYFWNTYYDNTDPDPDVNLVPVPTSVKSETCSSGGMNQYITGHFVTADSAIGMNKVWGAPDEDVSYIIEKWEIYSFDGATHTGVNLGEWVDMDVPSDSGAANFGTAVEADDYVYAQGLETDNDQVCIQNDGRFYMTGLLGYYNVSELAGDPAVNHTGLEGAHVTMVEDLMTSGYAFIADSVWSFFGKDAFTINNSENEDQRTFLDFGSFDITTDTLVIWIVHGTLINSDVTGVEAQNAAAKAWYALNRDAFGVCGCCGAFTGGYPGNTNCDELGKRNLADITKLIDHVYISKADLCCNENGNVNADELGKRNLADITKLIDHVYISKAETPLCL